MLRLGHSRRVFPVAEIGPRNAEDVVQGAFPEPSPFGHVQDFISRIHNISRSPPDSLGDHPLRERRHYQVVVGTLRFHNPSRHRNFPPGAHHLKQGRQEAFPLTHPPRAPAPNRRTVCAHPASPAHNPPSEPLLDPTFANVEPDRQPSLHAVRSVSGNPHREHVFEDEPPLGTHRVLLFGRANASMGALHFPVR